MRVQYIHNLYIRNQEAFHQWLFVKKSKIMTSVWTPLLFGGTVIVVALSSFVMMLENREISTREYDSIQSDIKHYSHSVPEYAPMAKKFMVDGKIVEWEYGELRLLTSQYYEEKDRLEHVEAKRKLASTVND